MAVAAALPLTPAQGSLQVPLEHPKRQFCMNQVKKIKDLAKGSFSYLSRNLLIGAAVSPLFVVGGSVMGLTLNYLLPDLVPKVSIEDLPKDPYVQFVSKIDVSQALGIGIREEFVFRGVFPYLINRVGSYMTGEKNSPMVHFISQVASAILFGYIHSETGQGPLHTIRASATGLALGVLREKVGILSSFTAHMLIDVSQSKIVDFLLKKGADLMKDAILWKTCSLPSFEEFAISHDVCVPR